MTVWHVSQIVSSLAHFIDVSSLVYFIDYWLIKFRKINFDNSTFHPFAMKNSTFGLFFNNSTFAFSLLLALLFIW